MSGPGPGNRRCAMGFVLFSSLKRLGEAHSCPATLSKPVNSFCLCPPPAPPRFARPLLRVLQGKINIFRIRCCHFFFYFHFISAMGNSHSLPLSQCTGSCPAFGFLLPPSKKSAPRENIVIATAVTTAAPQASI